MSECEEVAQAIADKHPEELRGIKDMNSARAMARKYLLPGETFIVVDNVAEALFSIAIEEQE